VQELAFIGSIFLATGGVSAADTASATASATPANWPVTGLCPAHDVGEAVRAEHMQAAGAAACLDLIVGAA